MGLGDYVSFPAVDGTSNVLYILVLVALIEKKEKKRVRIIIGELISGFQLFGEWNYRWLGKFAKIYCMEWLE